MYVHILEKVDEGELKMTSYSIIVRKNSQIKITCNTQLLDGRETWWKRRKCSMQFALKWIVKQDTKTWQWGLTFLLLLSFLTSQRSQNSYTSHGEKVAQTQASALIFLPPSSSNFPQVPFPLLCYHVLINVLRVVFITVCFKGVLYPLNLGNMNPTGHSSN